MTTWKLESVRLTAFPTEPVLDKSAHWVTVRQVEPHSDADYRVEGDRYSIAESPVEDGFVSLRTGSNGSRIDWLAGTVQGLTPVGEEPIAGEVEDWLVVLREIKEGFVTRASMDVHRLAVGFVLLEPVESRQAGYGRLGEWLKSYVQLDPESSEFRYQINRPRLSKVREAAVNRVSEWSVARLGAPQASADANRGEYRYMVRLALDLNTPPEGPGPIRPEDQDAVIEELIELGLEIAREGDKA